MLNGYLRGTVLENSMCTFTRFISTMDVYEKYGISHDHELSGYYLEPGSPQTFCSILVHSSVIGGNGDNN